MTGPDDDLATGRAMIAFARAHMPALAAAADAVAAAGHLRGRRVGLALMLEPKTACLATALADTGAEVVVYGTSYSTKDVVARALAADGITVHTSHGAPDDDPAADPIADPATDAFLDARIELLADDGAVLTRRLHAERRDVLPHLRGVAEETTSGVRPLRLMADAGALAVPVVAVNDARVKLLFDNVHGTGQSVVFAVADTAGLTLAGRTVVVVGYGRVGQGIAGAARGIGARVVVTEVDAVEALAAHHDGYEVLARSAALPRAEVVITATGIGHSLVARDLVLLPAGAVVAVGGMGTPEVAPEVGDEVVPPLVLGDEVRPNLREVHRPDGSTVLLVADGHCANTTAGEGNPIQVMDLSLALQLHALAHLASADLPIGVHLLPPEVEQTVAAAQLAAIGVAVDEPSAEQRAQAVSW